MKRIVFMFIGALTLGVFAAFGAFQVQVQAEQKVLARFETTEVLVTAKEIPALTSISDAQSSGLLKIVKFPTEYLPVEALRAVDSTFSSDLTVRTLPEGHLLLATDFGLPPEDSNGLVIPSGFTALSLDLTVANRAGGFLQPGREVGIVASTRQETAQGSRTITRTLLSGVKVLAVGTNTKIGSAETVSDAANVITLAIAPEFVTKVLNAVEVGTISLVLLSPGTSIELATSR